MPDKNICVSSPERTRKIDQFINSNNSDESSDKKLVGILKNTKMYTDPDYAVDKLTDSLKKGLTLPVVDDDLDEGLGDLDDVFEDFEEVYEATMRGDDEVGTLVFDKKHISSCETDSSGFSECDIDSPMSDLSIDSPFRFKSHNDSVSLYGTLSPADEVSPCLCSSKDNESSCSLCNKRRANDSDMKRTWMTDFSCDTSAQRCSKQSCLNNHGDSNMISPLSKPKSVHFAIFPYVIEIPRVADLELQFDSSVSNINNLESSDETTSDGNYDYSKMKLFKLM